MHLGGSAQGDVEPRANLDAAGPELQHGASCAKAISGLSGPQRCRGWHWTAANLARELPSTCWLPTRDETQREYEEAAATAAERQVLSDDDERELNTLFKKLARLYHPDRFAHDPEKHATQPGAA